MSDFYCSVCGMPADENENTCMACGSDIVSVDE